MALISTWTSNGANLVIDSALTVTYTRSLISGTWGYTAANVWGSYNYMMEYHRRARQSFRYVGMTYAAAMSCKAAMVTKYTRATYMSIWNDATLGGEWNTTSSGNMLMADISPQHNDDGSYDVIVQVNEDDTRMSKVGDSSPGFDYEVSREYEGGESEQGGSST